MLYRIYTPTPELANIIDCYWHAPIEANSNSTQQYNTPLFESLVFNFTKLKEFHQYEGKTTCIHKSAYFFGQTKSYTVISGTHEKGGYIIGVKFKPLGLAKVTGINMAHLTGRVVDAEDIWGNKLEWLCEAMQESNSIEAAIIVLEQFLKEQCKAVYLNPRINSVAQAIAMMKAHNGNVSCKMLQDLTNTGRKTLERAFINFHGMHPKTYIRIIRFNLAKQRMGDRHHINLTEIAHHLGYFDQSHFIKDFTKFSGQTPTGYLKTIKEERRKRTIPAD